jgi:Ser/Thr protein kinase RdoA (MazF antagonist)
VKTQSRKAELSSTEFEQVKNEYCQWLPTFQRLGLKPQRFIREQDAVYVGTNEGWFRLGLTEYDKNELKWLRGILEYLESRSFQHWAVPWQKTVIWEESDHCHLIQPWLFGNECFQAKDPASLARLAEILAELYRCGRDYREDHGIPGPRDRWSAMELEWETNLQQLDSLNEEDYHEKIRKDFSDLRKRTIGSISETLTAWRNSGIHSIHDHHSQSGTIGHGNLTADCLVWRGYDYYLINWERLSFQPRVTDLASFISDVGDWEPDWILFFINECSKAQPFWKEENEALLALLKYPRSLISLLKLTPDEIDRKDLKDMIKEATRRERCLTRIEKELSTQKRWAWSGSVSNAAGGEGKFSMVLSPVESWGGFLATDESIIQVNYDQKLPSEVIERLTNPDQDRILGGRDGNILDAATNIESQPPGYEITEEQPIIPQEQIEPFPEPAFTQAAEPVLSPEPRIRESKPIQWSRFPQPIRAR